MTTASKSNPLAIAVLTRSQRHALHAAAARRAQHLRKQAKRATTQKMPNGELDHLASEAATAALISRLTTHAEAIIIHSPTTGRPASLPEQILGQACQLAAAHTSNDTTATTANLSELKRLIDLCCQQLPTNPQLAEEAS